jgi:subtilisin family serine protease
MAVTRRARRRAVGIGAAALAAGLVPVLTAYAAPVPEGRIQYADAANAVPGSYIVVLKPETAQADSDRGRALAAKYRATIGRTYVKALNRYVVRATPTDYRRFAADPAVASMMQNRILHIDTTQTGPPSWGLDRIDRKSLPLDGKCTYPDSAGQGVTAYVIDTGVRVTPPRLRRPRLERLRRRRQRLRGAGRQRSRHACGGHRRRRLVRRREEGEDRRRTRSRRPRRRDHRQGHRGHRLGGPASQRSVLGGPVDSALDTAVRNTIASGVTFAVAAGNSSADASGFSPAHVSEALTVGATTSSDARASYSNYGKALDLFAPGSSITSTWNTGDTATATLSGTSMATPHVAGAAALYLADHPKATPAQVVAALTGAAATGVVTGPGTGSSTSSPRRPPGPGHVS